MRPTLPLLALIALASGAVAGCGAAVNPRLAQKGGTLELVMGANTITTGTRMAMGATGGKPPYAFSVASGSGTVNSSTGAYTAGASAGYVTLKVRDALGETDLGYLAVVGADADGGSPVSLAPATLGTRQTLTLAATGGTAPYAYAVLSGGGTIADAVFTAPAAAARVSVQATDAAGYTATATITVTASSLAVSPTSATVATGQTKVFTASGGTAPYTYTVAAGSGTVSADGTFTSPALPGSAVVTVTDAAGNIVSANVSVPPSYSLAPMSAGGSLIVDTYAAVTFSNFAPGSQDQPTLGLFGLGAGADAASVGVNGSSASMVVLNNFSNQLAAPVSYRGLLEIRGRTATTRITFCVAPNHRKLAYLRQESGPADSSFVSRTFNASGHALFNGRATRTFIANVDSGNREGSASVAMQAGYTTQVDCSDYDVSQFVTVY